MCDNKQIKNNNKIRKVFLDNLPRKCESIDWKKSIGYTVHFIYGNVEGDILITDYSKGYLIIEYLDEKPFKINSSSFSICAFGKLLSKYIVDFKYRIGQKLVDNKRDITIIDMRKDEKTGKKYCKYKCNKCGFLGGKHYSPRHKEYREEFWTEESSLLKGNGCVCCGIYSKILVEGINDIPTTTPWMIKYFQGGYDEAKKYTKGSNISIYPICPDCGRIKDKKMKISEISSRHSIGCICSNSTSYANKMMFNILEQLKIDFISEYSPYWIGLRRYDFYIPSLNIIIEMDGGWHNNDNEMSGQTSKESKFIDNEKDRLAREHNIEVIRIDCDYPKLEKRFEFIKHNILNNKYLSNVLCLDIINWISCFKYSLSNLVKIACEYKKNNPDISINEISELMSVGKVTIWYWLKRGKTFGWCNYDGEKEKSKSGFKGGKARGKIIEIFKDGLSLGIFPSVSELQRKSEELFGTKLNHGNISAVCLGKKENYKGYEFKYR